MTWPELRIVLALPPSSNDIWTVAKGRIISSKALRDFTKAAQQRLWHLSQQHHLQPLTGPVSVLATYFVPTLSSDGPNRDKALLDVLQGYVYENDRQIAHWIGFKEFLVLPGLEGRCEVQVFDFEHEGLAKRLRESKARQGAKGSRTSAPPVYGVPVPAVYRP